MSGHLIPDGLKYVPIRFMNDKGDVSDDPIGRPVVKVFLRFDPDHVKGPIAPSSYDPVYALLDTGADDNYGTAEAITSAGCPQIGTREVYGGTSSVTGSHHSGHLFFPEATTQIETDIFSAPLRNSSATENLVIGMSVIRIGRLVMDFKKGIYRLYLG